MATRLDLTPGCRATEDRPDLDASKETRDGTIGQSCAAPVVAGGEQLLETEIPDKCLSSDVSVSVEILSAPVSLGQDDTDSSATAGVDLPVVCVVTDVLFLNNEQNTTSSIKGGGPVEINIPVLSAEALCPFRDGVTTVSTSEAVEKGIGRFTTNASTENARVSSEGSCVTSYTRISLNSEITEVGLDTRSISCVLGDITSSETPVVDESVVKTTYLLKENDLEGPDEALDSATSVQTSELTIVLGRQPLCVTTARQDSVGYDSAKDTAGPVCHVAIEGVDVETVSTNVAAPEGLADQFAIPNLHGSTTESFSETVTDLERDALNSETLEMDGVHDEGGTRGKRETSGNGNLGLKEVEFKLDIGKRRLPSPDVKKQEKVRAPEFVVKPRRQFIDEGQSAKFKVSYDGSPATLTWNKDGKPLSDGKKYKIYEKDNYHFLEVLDVESGDSGMYVGTVANSAGTDTASAELDVFAKPKLLSRAAKPPPTLVNPLQDLRVAIGDQDVRLDCRFSDADDCQATWYHDGKELRQGRQHKSRFTGVGASLTITEIGEEDGGIYECVVSNASGEVRTSCTLSTDGERLEPPVFVKELQDLEVDDGDKVELIVEVKGTLPIQVYWLHNNCQVTVDTPGCVLRAADGVHSLLVPHASADSAGEYVCEAYNEYGDTDTFCRISVAEVDKPEPPEFLTRPKLLTIEEGAKATFTCCVTGHPPPVVRWERNGCTLSNNEKYQICSDDNSHGLEILAPDKSDAGQYICHAENRAGSVSHICSLVISHAKPVRSSSQDFRNVLKNRQAVGHIGKQRSTESERSDKENEARDFRSLLKNTGKITPPHSTPPLHDSRTVTGVNSTPRPATTSQSVRSGLKKALDLFEKNSASQERTRPTGRSASAAPAVRVKSAPVQEHVFNSSSTPRTQATPNAVSTRGDKEHSRLADYSSTDSVKTDFRSVLSHTQRSFNSKANTRTDRGGAQVKDSKPSWAKDSSTDSTKNGHNKDVNTLPSGRIDFRNVLKNKHSEKEGNSPKTTESKTGVRSKDFRSVAVGIRSRLADKQSNGLSHTSDTTSTQDNNFVRPVSKDVSSLKSKFEESSPRDFRDVHLKSVKPQQSADKPPSLTALTSKRSAELKIFIPDTQKKDFTFGRKNPELRTIDTISTNLSAFSPPSSDSSYLSDSSKVSENSKTSEASFRSEDTQEQLPDVTSFRNRRWRENGGFGSHRSSEISQRPDIQDRLADQRVRYGSKAVLKCKVVGVPEPDIKWSINHRAIKPSKFFQLSYVEHIAQLVVAEAFSEDEGEYTCTATNSAGTDSCSCYLTVEASSSQSSRSEGHTFEGPVHTPPRVLSLVPRDITVQRGQPVRLEVTYCGEPAPSVRWFQAKTEISPSRHFKIMNDNGKSLLVIDAVNPNDAGRYTVTITNDLGSDLMSATINVEDVPEPPIGKPHVYDVSKRSVSLSWCGPPFDGGSQVTHYAIEMRDSHRQAWTSVTLDCQSTSYHALDLIPELSYQFRVRAGNKLGLSEPSDTSEVVVMTDPLHTSEDYESDDELPFEPRKVDITPNRKFEDHYELLHEVGKGRFGNVYKCVERATEKTWAAKVVKCREKEKDNLRLEIEVMNRLAHPKLLMLWDAFEAPRKMVLVMEFIGAGELFERVIREDFELTERDCVHFVRQICDGVGYMHSQSILHLDLKPENVLCVSDNSNQIKIIDFGLARFYKPGESIRVLFGTPEFIAPEVINYDEIGYATDLWSIGVICYILLSGLSPFLGDNDAETLANVTSGEFDFEDDSFEDISESAKDFIRRLLIKRKEKRSTIAQCLEHPWLAQEDMRTRGKRLNTERLRCFMARRKWQGSV